MPFQSHLRDFSNPKDCKNNCPDCPKRLDRASTSHMGRTLPAAAPEVLAALRHRLRETFVKSALVDTRAAKDDTAWDGCL